VGSNQKALFEVVVVVIRQGQRSLAILDHLLGTPGTLSSNGSPVDRSVGVLVTVHGVTVHAVAVTMHAVAVSSSGRVATEASLPGEDGVDQLASALGVHEGGSTVQGNVVVAPVPDGGVGHAVGRKGKDGANDGASNDVVPVVILIHGQGTANQASTEDGSVDGNELPHGGVVVGKDLELGVEVERQVDKASKSSGGVTTGKGLEGVVDLLLVAGADVAGVVNLLEARAVVALVASQADVGLADGEEVGAQTTDEPLEEDLEDGGGDERVEQTNGGVVDVPEGADANLHDEEDDNGDDAGEERGEPDGDDFVAEGEAELGEDDLAVLEGDGKGSRGSRLRKVDLLQTQCVSEP
jgi:hypothetical protein